MGGGEVYRCEQNTYTRKKNEHFRVVYKKTSPPRVSGSEMVYLVVVLQPIIRLRQLICLLNG